MESFVISSSSSSRAGRAYLDSRCEDSVAFCQIDRCRFRCWRLRMSLKRERDIQGRGELPIRRAASLDDEDIVRAGLRRMDWAACLPRMIRAPNESVRQTILVVSNRLVSRWVDAHRCEQKLHFEA